MRSVPAKPGEPRPVVAVLAYDGMALFEFSVACEVFGDQSGSIPTSPWYELLVVGTHLGPVPTDRPLRVDVDHDLRALRRAHTIVVPPPGPDRYDPEPEIVAALRAAHARGARIASLCTGAFVLAATGLLDGRRVTTHWSECALLQERYPQLRVDPDVLYVADGDILTSAGSAASLDLCLHMVRSDLGADAASELARELVVAPHRDGGQAQFIRTPLPDHDVDHLFSQTLQWLEQHLADELSVDELARRAAMSRRTFARRFADTTGTTPYQWLLRRRVELAQRMLEQTDEPVDAVAAHCGFVTAANLRKHFARVTRTTPLAYRRAFAGAQPSSAAR